LNPYRELEGLRAPTDRLVAAVRRTGHVFSAPSSDQSGLPADRCPNLQSSKAGGLQPLGPANAQSTHVV